MHLFSNCAKQRYTEKSIEQVEFNIHKFNNRPRPDKDKIIVIGCFSEFGCEIIGSMYCIPKILQNKPGYYYIVAGWWGRAYLYKYLVDEFWELKEDYQCLRDNTNAFGYTGKNLRKIEKKLGKDWKYFPTSYLGNLAVGSYCKKCNYMVASWEPIEKCSKCGESENFTKSILSEHEFNKKFAVRIPYPSKAKLEWAREWLNSLRARALYTTGNHINTFWDDRFVAVFARSRKTYGRNLPPTFYADVAKLLIQKGYTPVFLGEKQSVMEAPEGVLDFSRCPESRDLESTLAIICNCDFTVQFWTASTRLAGVMGVPWILFETPDQVYAKQEGVRQALTTFGEKKLCLCDFNKVCNDLDGSLKLLERCIKEVEEKNYEDIVGLVDNEETTIGLINSDFYKLNGQGLFKKSGG